MNHFNTPLISRFILGMAVLLMTFSGTSDAMSARPGAKSAKAAKAAAAAPAPMADSSVSMIVNRSPSCTCCGKWVENMRQNGFKVDDRLVQEMPEIKQKLKVPADLQSCHTAEVGGYVIEGHVPAADIQQLLQKKPKITGLAVPGMPRGTPGMEVGIIDPFTVESFDDQGHKASFHDYPVKN